MDRDHLNRRQLLRLAAATPVVVALAHLAGCSRKPQLDATFLQPWLSHIDLPREEWARRMAVTRSLGCHEVILQWVGQQGGNEPDWALPDNVLSLLFETTAEQNMTLRVGLPFDRDWWAVLGKDASTRAAFFDHTLADASRFMRDSRWARMPTFAGWYIPYELEQFNWPDRASQQDLAKWLAALAEVAKEAGKGAPAISTYFSALETSGSLVELWDTVLDEAALRPMVQDGVGVAGWGNLKQVEPLIKRLGRRGVAFDVVVELFQQVSPDNAAFQARSADFARVDRQLVWAGDSGAKNVVGFAVDPWVLEDSEGAKALLGQWLERRA